MKVTNWVAAALVCAFGQVALAEEAIQPGVYYDFTRSVAEQLNINYDSVLAIARLKNGEHLVVKQDEENGEIDLSIFDNAQFASARSDILGH